uniref:zinc-binding protein A33-like n=1 Tax=Pristiophorus japonicus TaxID=55135 RepID=UPI00398ED33C
MMPSARSNESSLQDLVCSVCLELFVDPVILCCGHSFCHQCMQACRRHQAGTLACPECREEVGQRPARPNQAVRQLTEVAHSQAHLYCEQHGRRLKLFCHVNLQLICVVCRASPWHAEHQESPAKEAAEFYKEKLQVTMISTQAQWAAFNRLLSSEHDKVPAVKESSEVLLSHIKEEFAQMHSFLQEREEHLARELAEHENSILKQLQENLQKVQEGLSSLDTQLVKLSMRLNQDDDIEFLKPPNGCEFKGRELLSRQAGLELKPGCWQAMVGTQFLSILLLICSRFLFLLPSNFTNNDHVHRPDEIQMPSEVSTVIPLGVFKGPLQYKAWKEMKDFISPVPASLTFDPNSAHQKLLVSEDLTRVRLTDSVQQQLHTAERFSPCVNILAAQGYVSGRHYWEVEVGDKTAWDLGVAKESVQKRGRITLSPVDGFWALWLRDGNQYKALDWPAVPLPLAVKPRKVGVYLDFEGGQVSFYDADNLSHLYTFKDTFPERVFPYFSPYLSSCTGNAEGLTLCTLKL